MLRGVTAALAEARQVTALFVDLVSSTPLAEPDSRAATLLQRYSAAVIGEVERHGGFVSCFVGDGALCLFGVPVAHPDDAVRAIRCALAMHAAIERLSAELGAEAGIETGGGLRLRIGIHTGVVGIRRGPPTVDDTAGSASQLQVRAPDGGTLVCPTTIRLAQDLFEFEARLN